MSSSRCFAVMVGGALGFFALAVTIIFLIWFFMLHLKRLPDKSSEKTSADSSILVELKKGEKLSIAGYHSQSESLRARQFTLQELEDATKKFSESNLVGHGSFGLAYKGLLNDGTSVTIQRRSGSTRNEFIEEVNYLSEIRHRNLVSLLGYCQEGGFQMIVSDYVPNGSVSIRLYDALNGLIQQLEFKQRLSIAVGTAKGLCHLHGLNPPLVHGNFTTRNVLVDENLIAKIADFGTFKLLQRMKNWSPSQQYVGNSIFRDPGIRSSTFPIEMNDVYSFGVFLLELITGEDASSIRGEESSDSLIQWVETHLELDNFVDRRLGNSFTSEGIKDCMKLVIQCLNPSAERRPKMREIVSDLDEILEREMTATTVLGDGTAIVTLGSQLFTT